MFRWEQIKKAHNEGKLITQSGGFIAGFWEHIDELKKRLKVIIIVLLASTAFFMIFPANPQDMFSANFWLSGLYRPMVSVVLNWIKNFLSPKGLEIISLEIGAPFEIYFLAAFFLGLVVTSPVIAYEVYKFIDPALYPHERKSIYPFVLGFTCLFLVGSLFGLFVLAPFIMLTVIIFSQIVGSAPIISVADFYSMILITVALTGLSFTLPVFFLLLAKFRILKTSFITKNRVYFYVGLFIVTAIITPDGGPLADLALFLPMVVLWEIALFLAKRYEKSDADKNSTAAADPHGNCKFCGNQLSKSDIFCPKCGRSNQ